MGRSNKDCENCTYDSKDVTEEPCFKCLSSYFSHPCFLQRPNKIKVSKKKQKNIPKDENTPLPWT